MPRNKVSTKIVTQALLNMKLTLIIAVILSVVLEVGCKREVIVAPQDPTTKIAEIRLGMSEADLTKLLGPASDSRPSPPPFKVLIYSKPASQIKEGNQIMGIQVILKDGVVEKVSPVWGSRTREH